MLIHAKLSKNLYSKAYLIIIYMMNRISREILELKIFVDNYSATNQAKNNLKNFSIENI